jgi:hypothetical protein
VATTLDYQSDDVLTPCFQGLFDVGRQVPLNVASQKVHARGLALPLWSDFAVNPSRKHFHCRPT